MNKCAEYINELHYIILNITIQGKRFGYIRHLLAYLKLNDVVAFIYQQVVLLLV